MWSPQAIVSWSRDGTSAAAVPARPPRGATGSGGGGGGLGPRRLRPVRLAGGRASGRVGMDPLPAARPGRARGRAARARGPAPRRRPRHRRRPRPCAGLGPTTRRSRSRPLDARRRERARCEVSAWAFGEPHEGDVEQQAGIGGVTELDQRLAQHLHGPDGGGGTEAAGLVDHARRPPGRGARTSSGAISDEEARRGAGRRGPRRACAGVAAGTWWRSPTPARAGAVSASISASTISSSGGVLGSDAAGGHDLVERRQHVARRPAALAQDGLDGVVADVEPGVGDDVRADAPRARRWAAGGTRGAACGCGWWR